MNTALSRFICVLEEAGTFAVWDSFTSRPATLGGCELTGRDEQRAIAACQILNRIFANRMQRDAVRSQAGTDQHSRFLGDDT